MPASSARSTSPATTTAATLVIDDHGSRVHRAGVAGVRARAATRSARVPTLVEWDTELPALEVLLGEAREAARLQSSLAPSRGDVDTPIAEYGDRPSKRVGPCLGVSAAAPSRPASAWTARTPADSRRQAARRRGPQSMVTEALRQQMLVRALLREAEPASLHGWLRDDGPGIARGLEAHASHAGAAAERALSASFPTLRALLGEASFAALSRAYWHARPPARGDLFWLGEGLPGFVGASAQLEERSLSRRLRAARLARRLRRGRGRRELRARHPGAARRARAGRSRARAAARQRAARLAPSGGEHPPRARRRFRRRFRRRP